MGWVFLGYHDRSERGFCRAEESEGHAKKRGHSKKAKKEAKEKKRKEKESVTVFSLFSFLFFFNCERSARSASGCQ